MNRTIVRRLVQLAVLGLVVLGVVVFVRHLDGPKIAALLREASWPLLSIALGLTIAGIGAQILRTQRILEPTKLVPLRRLAHYHLAGGAATNLLPARAGPTLASFASKPRTLTNRVPTWARTAVTRRSDLSIRPRRGRRQNAELGSSANAFVPRHARLSFAWAFAAAKQARP